MTDHLAPFRRYFRYAALTCTGASAILTAWFGLNQNPYVILALACMVFLVACSVASDYIGLFLIDAWRRRHYGQMAWTIVGALVVVSLNVMSNVGSVGWQKDVTSTQAKVHNTKVDDKDKVIRATEKQISEAETSLSDLIRANGWAASVANAESLRARMTSASLAIEQEAKRGGCGPKCLALTKERDDLESRIATVEQRTKIQHEISNKRAELALLRAGRKDVTVKVDAASSQSSFFGGLFTASLNPDETVQAWTSRGMSVWLALGLVFAPMLFSMLGWRSDDHHDTVAGNSNTVVRKPSEATVTVIKPARQEYTCTTIGQELRARLAA